MSLWLDEKYIRLLSPQLERFSDKGRHVYQFRCPLCGDSEANKSKARGYTFPKGQTLLMYKCHNCGLALPFSALLRSQSRHLYDQYLLETLDVGRKHQEYAPEPAKSFESDVPEPGRLEPLTVHSVSSSPLYAVYKFMVDRGVPRTGISQMAATAKAYSWVLPLVGEEKAQKVKDGPAYLVQPLVLPNGTWYGAQLRDISKKEYLTFRWSSDPLKVFGLNTLKGGTVHVVEGPIDSLFIPNSIAACGSALIEAVRIAIDLGHVKADQEKVYVWDNEPRNTEVRRQIRNAIRLKERVVIWPVGMPHKDINDMVRAGISADRVLALIGLRTFVGLRAELEFEAWKR